MWPVICLNKRSIRSLEKALDRENRHLYHKVCAVSCFEAHITYKLVILCL